MPYIKKEALLICLFLSATLLLVVAIFLRKPISKDTANDTVLLTVAQANRTQALWANQPFVRIDTNSEFVGSLRNIPLVEDGVKLSAAETESLRQASMNLVFAYYLGDYQAYRKFRTPTANFEMPPDESKSDWDEWFKAVYPNAPIPNSFADTLSNIWVKVYGNRPYWKSLGLTNSEITVSMTNNSPSVFVMNLPTNAHSCMVSVSQGTYSYKAIIENNLLQHNLLKIAKMLFWADTADPANKPRPILFVLVLDADSNVWLPIQIAQCFTSQNANPFPF